MQTTIKNQLSGFCRNHRFGMKRREQKVMQDGAVAGARLTKVARLCSNEYGWIFLFIKIPSHKKSIKKEKKNWFFEYSFSSIIKFKLKNYLNILFIY